MEQSDALDALQTFRESLYRCFDRRADVLFELTDAILTAGVVPSPVHLSLEAVHRRGWGSLYAALWQGRIDAEALRSLLVRYPLPAESGTTPVYALDVSVWSRCDAESSPERGFYYHPSRHSAGQPIVAGWAYQWIVQLGFARESWVAPMDVLSACGLLRTPTRSLPSRSRDYSKERPGARVMMHHCLCSMLDTILCDCRPGRRVGNLRSW
jgi:DDE superfamily endonuclease